jgi:hypothetical protein
MIPDEVKLLIEKKINCSVGYNKDFDSLSLKIKDSIKVDISPATLKRMWFDKHNVKNHRLITLDTIAKFLGFQYWEDIKP